MRFLHTSDWQLGMTRHFLDADAQPRYTAARIDAIKSIGEIAVANSCEFILVCGDVFESNAVSPQTVGRAMEALAAVPLPVYLLPGNHDPLDAASIYTSKAFVAAKPSNVHVLDTTGVHAVSAGTEIVAAPWFSKHPLNDSVAEAISPLQADGTLRIVAGHGAVDSLSPDATAPSVIQLAPITSALENGGVHYVALGDRHSKTQVGNLPVWYSGTPLAVDFREVDPGHVLLVTFDENKTATVESKEVGTWTFRDLSLPVNTDDDVNKVRESLAWIPNKDTTIVRLAFTGTLSLKQKSDLDEVVLNSQTLFASVQLWERNTDLAVYVYGDELHDLGLGGFADQAASELEKLAAVDDAQGKSAQDALSLLYRLARSI